LTYLAMSHHVISYHVKVVGLQDVSHCAGKTTLASELVASRCSQFAPRTTMRIRDTRSENMCSAPVCTTHVSDCHNYRKSAFRQNLPQNLTDKESPDQISFAGNCKKGTFGESQSMSGKDKYAVDQVCNLLSGYHTALRTAHEECVGQRQIATSRETRRNPHSCLCLLTGSYLSKNRTISRANLCGSSKM